MLVYDSQNPLVRGMTLEKIIDKRNHPVTLTEPAWSVNGSRPVESSNHDEFIDDI